MLIDPQERLDSLLASAGLNPLQDEQNKRLIEYMTLLLRWNRRTNLTAVRDLDAILERHFLESIACAQFLPIGMATLLDYGSGAGFPGIPIAICRPEIAVTLAESQNKKAAFLREAVRVAVHCAKVHSGRAETLDEKFDCVTLRAVDNMELAVKSASQLVSKRGCLILLTTQADQHRLTLATDEAFEWARPLALPGGDQRIMALAWRVNPRD